MVKEKSNLHKWVETQSKEFQIEILGNDAKQIITSSCVNKFEDLKVKQITISQLRELDNKYNQ